VTRNNKVLPSRLNHWNGYNLENLMSIKERASLVPAAAVIPALLMYRIIVAIKKFVVGLSDCGGSVLTDCTRRSVLRAFSAAMSRCAQDYFERLKCSKRVLRLNTGAWNNGTRSRPSFIGFVG
jgi:hypothetical protein